MLKTTWQKLLKKLVKHKCKVSVVKCYTKTYEGATDMNEFITKIIVNIFIKSCQAIFYVSAKAIAFNAKYTKPLMIFYPLKIKQARVTHTKHQYQSGLRFIPPTQLTRWLHTS